MFPLVIPVIYPLGFVALYGVKPSAVVTLPEVIAVKYVFVS